MKKVKYTGDLPATLPTLGLEVKPGQEIEVPDDFNNALFVDVVENQPKKEAK